MSWFFIALLAPALSSITNHIDKYLVSKYFKGGGIGALLIFSSLIGLFVLPFILIFNANVFQITSVNALIIIVSGIIYMLALIPYLYALEKDEASIVVALFQVMPIFTFILGYFFLGETLNSIQIFGSILIISGAIGITLDISGKKTKFKKEIFLLMFLATFLLSVNSLLFKIVAIKETFWVTSFWQYIGFFLFSLFLFTCIKPYRRQFLEVIRFNKVPIIGLNAFNEVVNILAVLIMNYAILLAPMALVWTVDSLSSFFVFIYGIIITIFFPKFGKETLVKKHLIQKILAIIIMFVGVVVLNIYS